MYASRQILYFIFAEGAASPFLSTSRVPVASITLVEWTCNARLPVIGDKPSSAVARCQVLVNTALKTGNAVSLSPAIMWYEKNGFTSCDPFERLIVPLEASDIVLNAHTSVELALEKVAFIQK